MGPKQRKPRAEQPANNNNRMY